MSSDAPLPVDWSKHISSKTGKPYWFNKRTNESRYEAPEEAPPAKRARPDDTNTAAAAPGAARSTALGVGAAYSALPSDAARGGRGARAFSRTRHLRAFQNWVKAVLISTYAPRPCARVLDLACGRLGDLAKWRLAGARDVCGVDIASESLRDACGRVATDRNANSALKLRLVRADLGATDLEGAGVLAKNEKFDAISCQMAVHYFFQSERRALTFFKNIAGRLTPGGVFLGTTTDSNVLVRRVRDAAAKAANASALTASPVTFGNALFRVRFDAEAVEAQWALGGSPYGCRYNFWLADSVEDSVTTAGGEGGGGGGGGGSNATESASGIDEYLVPYILLERLARAAGLEPVARENFHDFFKKYNQDPTSRALLGKMGVLDIEGSLGSDEWEVAGLYRIFVFRAPLLAPAVSTSTPPADVLPPMSQLVMHDDDNGGDDDDMKSVRRVPEERSPLVGKVFISTDDIIDLIGEEED